MPYTTAQWQRFFELADRKDLVHDPRVTLPQRRSESIGELYSILAEIVEQRSTSDWIAVLRQADVPCAPVNSPEDLLSDDHLQAIGFFQDCTHPSEGKIRTMQVPVKFSRTPGGIRRLAPKLDEHRDEIVNELTAALMHEHQTNLKDRT
jgi:crotonobetainyl-CoA:carnitine CoA-transferase CaiB-like acyl-CoA transferase